MPLDDDLDGIVLGPEDGNVFRRNRGGPKLRLVTDGDKPKQPRSRRPKNWRLPPSDKPWLRLWLSELGYHSLFSPAGRLLMVLRYRAFEDRDELVLTEEIAREANIPPRHRSHVAQQLEQLGLLQIRHVDRKQLIVVPTTPPR